MSEANPPIDPPRARVASVSVSAPPQPPPEAAELRILIADDDPLVRGALRAVLADQVGLRIDGEAADGVEAIELAIARRPDIVLLDEGICGLDAMTVIQRIRDAVRDVQVVVFSAAEDDDRGVAGLRSGASGFLLKEMSSDALVRALRGLAHGEAPLSRSLTLRLVEQLHRDTADVEDPRPLWSTLTTSEWEVLDLMNDGGSIDEVTRVLSLTPGQVNDDLDRILIKLGVKTAEEALSAARKLRAGEPWPSQGSPLDEVTRRRLDAARELRSRQP
jgi:DNA-binding NarL/FixJ family response regulator